MSQVTKRILLVDDSRIARLTLQHLITSTDSSVEITQAANGDEAIIDGHRVRLLRKLVTDVSQRWHQ